VNKREPLALPAGSIRAILTLILVGITAAMLFVPVVEGAGDIRAMFVLLTGIAIRDYFAQRSTADASEKPDYYLPSEGQ
jgi:hypothetical protein